MKNITKNSFVLYHDITSVIEDLTDEQAGQIFKEIYKCSIFQNQTEAKETERYPNGLNGLLKAVFNPFEKHIERDFVSYCNKVQKNRENALKGGRPSNKEAKKKTERIPKKPDNGNGNGNGNGNTVVANEFDLRASKYLFAYLNKIHNIQEPDFSKWADHIRKMREIDKRTEDMIKNMIDMIFKDNEHFDGNFWRANIKSTAKLREKYDDIALQIKTRSKAS
jgi:hypothetical protein